MVISFLTILVGCYLLGSIPSGLILTWISGGGDIRKIGSGNIGATNVLRTGKKGLAALTLFLDGAKGWAATFIPATFLYHPHLCPPPIHSQFMMAPDEATRCVAAILLACLFGMIAVMGHVFPVWLKFKGGKGVATFIGMMLGIAPVLGIACIFAWVLTALITRTSSASALVAVGLSPLFMWLFIPLVGSDKTTACIIVGLLAVLIWIRHETNIVRIIKNTEPKIGKKEAA